MDNILNELIDNLKENDEKYSKLSKNRQIFNKIIDLINIINYKEDNNINDDSITTKYIDDLGEEYKKIFFDYCELIQNFKNKHKNLVKMVLNGKTYFYNRKATAKKYYDKTKDIKEKCEGCGLEYKKHNKTHHLKTLKHLNNLKKENN